MQKPVILCVEGSHSRGMGHIYRSLRVAFALREGGHACLFVCNDNPTALGLLRSADFSVQVVPLGKADGQWEAAVLRDRAPLVWWNDRMETGAAHAAALAAMCPHMPRVHVDDAGKGGERATARLLTMPCFFDLPAPAGGRQYAGAEYALLDPSLATRGHGRLAPSTPWRVLVSMGGSDTYGATIFVLRQLLALPAEQAVVTCITGPGFEHAEELRPLLEQRPQWLHKSAVPSLFDEFDKHDALICAGGMTPFEAAATGLPCCVLPTEEHEEANALYLQRQGCAVLAGQRCADVIAGDFTDVALFRGDVCRALEAVMQQLPALSAKGRQVCDGRGVLRCAALVSEFCHG